MQDLPPILDEQLADAQALKADPSYMKIHNLSELPVLDYRSVLALQGNLKDLSVKNHDKLLKVLKKRGFTTPLFVWQEPESTKMYLLDGHQRQRVMVKNDLNDDGNYSVPYALIPGDNLQAAKEQLLEITSQYGTMTMDGLDEFAFDIDVGSLDVNFDALDLDKYLDNLIDDDEADDEAPEVDEVNPPVSVLGQVYQLGAHRLMCGDATKLEDTDKLIDGPELSIDLLLTDPPYGINLNNDWQNKVHKDNPNIGQGSILNDKGEITSKLFEPWPHRIVFGFPYLQDSFADGWLVWDKEPDFKGRSLTSPIEMAYSTCWKGFRAIRLLWSGYLRESGSEDKVGHPTQKPVRLLADLIKDNSKRGQKVLDLFGGSGSTLIACESTDRICYMMELDPKYCDVIRKRYAKHIGAEDWESVTPALVYEAA